MLLHLVQLPTEVVVVAAEEVKAVKGVDGRGKGSVVGRSCSDNSSIFTEMGP
jgi:hypothetical protein